MENVFPEAVHSEPIRPDKVYYETRNFINNILPFSLHTDYMVKTSHHYVHKHREIEILMPISGEGQVIADLKPIPLRHSDVVIINPNKVHFIVSEDVFKYYCLIIDSEFLLQSGIDPSTLCFEDHIVSGELADKIRRIDREWQCADEYRNLQLRALLMDLIIYLCRNHLVSDTITQKESRTLRKIKVAINYIKNNFRRDLTLDEITIEAGLSKYHFCREFKKATDLTPIEFINRTRCEFAKSLLETKKYTVNEISEMCGFSTSAHFSRTFRMFFNLYPSEFVRMYKDQD